MTREKALREIREKTGELEDFLMNDISIGATVVATGKLKTEAVNTVDPNFENEKINDVVNACQFLVKWCAEEIAKCKAKREEEEKKAEEERKKEEERLDEMGMDEVYEEEVILTLDDELRDRGLSRADF